MGQRRGLRREEEQAWAGIWRSFCASLKDSHLTETQFSPQWNENVKAFIKIKCINVREDLAFIQHPAFHWPSGNSGYFILRVSCRKLLRDLKPYNGMVSLEPWEMPVRRLLWSKDVTCMVSRHANSFFYVSLPWELSVVLERITRAGQKCRGTFLGRGWGSVDKTFHFLFHYGAIPRNVPHWLSKGPPWDWALSGAKGNPLISISFITFSPFPISLLHSLTS